MKFRKKPVVIEAVFYDQGQESFDAIKALGCPMDQTENVESDPWSFKIKTLEGDMKVQLGDYVIKGIKGEFYPCKPDIFEATYEKVTD